MNTKDFKVSLIFFYMEEMFVYALLYFRLYILLGTSSSEAYAFRDHFFLFCFCL